MMLSNIKVNLMNNSGMIRSKVTKYYSASLFPNKVHNANCNMYQMRSMMNVYIRILRLPTLNPRKNRSMLQYIVEGKIVSIWLASKNGAITDDLHLQVDQSCREHSVDQQNPYAEII